MLKRNRSPLFIARHSFLKNVKINCGIGNWNGMTYNGTSSAIKIHRLAFCCHHVLTSIRWKYFIHCRLWSIFKHTLMTLCLINKLLMAVIMQPTNFDWARNLWHYYFRSLLRVSKQKRETCHRRRPVRRKWSELISFQSRISLNFRYLEPIWNSFVRILGFWLHFDGRHGNANGRYVLSHKETWNISGT